MSKTPQRRTGRALLVAVPLLILVVPIVYSIVSSMRAQAAPVPPEFLEMPDPQHEECVRDTDYMRFHHWELLRAVREEVVRYGMRENPGLLECRRCHTSRERFCNRCHEAVSLYPDCWGCHYYP
jgi:hypothetical protein